MEDTTANHHKTKVDDSAYSLSCNSQSESRGSGSGSHGHCSGSGSSKSRHSRSSGSSSGYCGHPSTLSSVNEPFPQPTLSKRFKPAEHKKKKKPKLSSATSSQAGVEGVAMEDCSVTSSNNVALGGSGALGVGVGGAIMPGPENGALQTAALSGGTNNKLANETQEDIPEVPESQVAMDVGSTTEQVEDVKDTCPQVEPVVQIPASTEFCAIVSMQDGVVMHTSASLSDVLGFPKNMWHGRSFIDFVHVNDRVAFAGNITSGVAAPRMSENDAKSLNAKKPSFFCRLRCYRGLKTTGFGVTDKRVTYLPFQLTTAFREVDRVSSVDKMQTTFLVITAKLVQTVYKHPEETRVSPKFSTRHLPSCHLSHVDPEVVAHFGHLPQDMIGRSVMDFYHPEDLPYLKEVYEAVIQEKEPSYRSKPYRFRVQNGGYVLLETEWSSFVNPWTRKLEFVNGRHRVLKGPDIPDVFAPPREEDMLNMPEEVLKESKLIEEEIQTLLQKTITRSAVTPRQQMSKRCKDLADFMDTLMDNVTKPNLKLDLPGVEPSFSERDSVILGEISPHHDYFDSKSKSSTETPPSYNQLNYNENIQRFFESQPKTTLSEESGEAKTDPNRSHSTDEEGKSQAVGESSLGSSTDTNRKRHSAVNDSGSGSGSGHSSGSACQGGSAGSRGDVTSHTQTSSSSYQPHHLTEELLYRHNEDMEKRMVQKHREVREHRSKGGERSSKVKKCAFRIFQEQCQGLKRSNSNSWEGEPYKLSKQQLGNAGECTKEAATSADIAMPDVGAGTSGNMTPLYQGLSDMNIWPQYSMEVVDQPRQSPSVCSTAGLSAAPAHFIPVYYIPSMPSRPPVRDDRDPMAYIPQQVSYVDNVVYQPVQMFYSPMVLQPAKLLQQTVAQNNTQKEDEGFGDLHEFQRPPSQATSVKAEPGSALGSIASASLIRCTLSESSKKELALTSPVSLDEKSKAAAAASRHDVCVDEDSCFSSFYSLQNDSVASLRDERDEYSIDDKSRDEFWCNRGSDVISNENSRPVLKEPPWLEQVTVTSDLVYRYRLLDRTLESTLEADAAALKSVDQSRLVNEQLSQFYLDMELEGLTTRLMLDEGFTSSGSSGEEATLEPSLAHRQPLDRTKMKRRSIEYDKLTMVYEENAPFPPPILACQ